MEWLSHPHAAYIWPAYLVAVLVIGGLTGISLRAHRLARRALREAENKTGGHS